MKYFRLVYAGMYEGDFDHINYVTDLIADILDKELGDEWMGMLDFDWRDDGGTEENA